MTATRTTCPYCGVGCGIVARVAADGTAEIGGDPAHPANFRRLCSKGSALGETLGLEDRLLYPEIGGRRAGWDEALCLVAERFGATIAEHGPDAVAFYVSGQLLSEDYYVANKLMKGFIGSANIDTNSRLCMASSVAGHRRAFGSDTVPGLYEDLELADLVVLVGSNLAWCHPVLYQRLAAAKKARPQMRVVLIDPRRTMTADIADMHLAIAPDGDAALFVGLLAELARRGRIDQAYVRAHTTGLEDALAAARALSQVEIARLTGLAVEEIASFYELFAATERTVTVYSQGVNQSSSGTDKVSAILNCHLATGRIGRPGAGPFSVTGQPNAMGGREVGGLANMLAAHMEIERPEHRALVARFWKAPRIATKPGLKAVDMFQAVAAGKIKALWIMATNPADSLPDADAVEAALKACPFVVVSDVVAATDTLRHAHVRLPAAAWGEKDGTVTNSERRISRQRAFLPLPGEARPDWWIVCGVARRMGLGAAFDYPDAAAIFAEHAALSAFGNAGTRAFDIGAHAGITPAQYDALEPFLWPAPADAPAPDSRFFSDGRFFTPDGRARIVAVVPERPVRAGGDLPLVLNTGRVRDHWHTMTRTARSARLSGHAAEPFAELHPADAARLGIGADDLVEIENELGRVVVRAAPTPRQRPGSVFVPMHWSDRFAARARIGALIPPVTDPHSGQPALKHVAVRARRFEAACHGFAVARDRPSRIDADYWALARCSRGWRLELAFSGTVADPASLAAGLFGVADVAEVLAYHDARRGDHRLAVFDGPVLVGALFLSAGLPAISRPWAAAQLGAGHADARARYRVAAGRAGADRADPGAIVCSCFAVGVNQIIAAVVKGGCASVDAVGAMLKAGTNCGSCRAEIREILDERRVLAAE